MGGICLNNERFYIFFPLFQLYVGRDLARMREEVPGFSLSLDDYEYFDDTEVSLMITNNMRNINFTGITVSGQWLVPVWVGGLEARLIDNLTPGVGVGLWVWVWVYGCVRMCVCVCLKRTG